MFGQKHNAHNRIDSMAPVIAAVMLLAVLGCGPVAKSSHVPRAAVSSVSTSELNQQTNREPLKLPLVSPRILVRKGDRTLELYSQDVLLRTYKIGLGFSPVADKNQEGDGATPEGEFYVFVKNNRSAYYLSLGISYPNAEDADRGLRDRLINRAQHRAITEAIRNKTAPPNTQNWVG
jgi:murein L,D-transpeptidase YafK